MKKKGNNFRKLDSVSGIMKSNNPIKETETKKEDQSPPSQKSSPLVGQFDGSIAGADKYHKKRDFKILSAEEMIAEEDKKSAKKQIKKDKIERRNSVKETKDLFGSTMEKKKVGKYFQHNDVPDEEKNIDQINE